MPLTVEHLWEEFSQDLRAFLHARVRDHSAADDLLQEVFLKLHRHLPDLRESERVEAWIYQVARNAVTQHFRRAQRSSAFAAELPELATETEPDLPDLRPTVRRFLDQLSSDHREVLLATEWEGVTQAAYAERLGLSLPAAKSRVLRARAELKRLLDECCRFELDRRGTIVEAIARTPTSAHDSSCSCGPASGGGVST